MSTSTKNISFEGIVRLARALTGMPVAALSLFEGAGERLIAASGFDPDRASAAGPDDAVRIRERLDIHEFVSVPVIREDEVIGMLWVAGEKAALLSRDQLDHLRALATQTDAALELMGLRSSSAQQQQAIARAAMLCALGEMASSLAHEINTPLAIVNGRVHQLRELANSGPIDAGQVAQLADKIEATTQRIAKIASTLRTFVRREAREELRPVEVRGLITDALELTQERIRMQNITFKVDNRALTSLVKGRSVELSQVLVNLLANACDALAGVSPGQLSLEAREEGEWVRIDVLDNGQGIPEHARGRIFEPFFTTKPVGQGTGLGLSISQRILQEHGGKIDLDCTPGATRFVIRLPRHKGTAQENGYATQDRAA